MVWQNETLSDSAQAVCGKSGRGSDIVFTEDPGSVDVSWVGYNFLAPQTNTNLLVFRDDMWPPQDPTAVDIIALSTITYGALTGEIIDADIEFNSANFSFSSELPNDQQMDLLSTAVHEIGHFVGLAHCSNSGTCGKNEVMEPTANLGEYDKRALRCDDLRGLIFKYPAGAANGYASKVASLTSQSEGYGTCLPPQESQQRPMVRQVARDQGRKGCQQAFGSGQAMHGVLAGLLLLAGPLRKRMRRHQGASVWPCAIALWLCSCTGPAVCGGPQNDDRLPQSPLILSMDLVGQVDIDPWHVVLRADVTDGDGDLGAGSVDYFVNGSTVSAEKQQMDRVFNASGGVPANSTDALLQLLVRFSRATLGNAYLHLGTQLTDGAGNKSNCYQLDLSYLLTQIIQ